jgi:DNA-binding GntR family transcriptional regulator
MSIVVRNLSDQLVELVRNRILAGQVPADLPIRQDALAAELGVSKIPLREALARLEQEGLIRSQANRGFFVRALSTEEAEEVYALRLKLEPDVTAAAALRATDEQRETAVGALASLDRAMSEHGDNIAMLNRAFHLTLMTPSMRAITVNILQRLHVLSERYVRKHLEPHGRNERASEEHRQLLQAWLQREERAVASLVYDHIHKSLEDLRKQLGSDVPAARAQLPRAAQRI